MAEVREYYDRYWSEEGFNPSGEMAPETARLVRRILRPPMLVADVGCGDGGGFGAFAAAHGLEYQGFDVSDNAVRRARKLGLQVERVEDASRLPIDDDSVDAVVCLEVLEHLVNPSEAGAEFYRVTGPGGLLIASVPNIAYWVRRVELGLLGRFNPYGDRRSVREPWRDPHLRFFTRGTITQMLRDAGYTTVRVAAEAHQPFSLRSRFEGTVPYLRLMRRWPALMAPTLLVTAAKPAPDQGLDQ